VHTIKVLTDLPVISDPLTIDGYSQAGATANTNDLYHADNAAILIELDGSTGSATRGLNIQASITHIRGLNIHGFSSAQIFVKGHHDSIAIEGNFIGTDVTGMAAGAMPAGADHRTAFKSPLKPL
jgi:hypothetical protein